jgi:hypothetical protein
MVGGFLLQCYSAIKLTQIYILSKNMVKHFRNKKPGNECAIQLPGKVVSTQSVNLVLVHLFLLDTVAV